MALILGQDYDIAFDSFGNQIIIIFGGEISSGATVEIAEEPEGPVALSVADLASGTPDVETPSVGQTHALSCADLDSGTPDVETPSVGQEHVLSCADLDSGTPDVETVTVGQTHALTNTDLTTGTPDVDTATLAEKHVLSVADLASGIPDLDAVTIGQTHALTIGDLSSGTPDLDTPVLAEGDSLTVGDLASGTPDVETPTLGVEADSLTVGDLASGIPDVETPSLGQEHALSLVDLSSGTPDIEVVTIGQEHALTLVDVASGVPDLDTPTAEGVEPITVGDLASGIPVFDAVTMWQEHALSLGDVATGVPSVPTPNPTQIHDLTNTDITGNAFIVPTPTMGCVSVLSLSGLSVDQITLPSPVLALVEEYNQYLSENGIFCDDTASYIDVVCKGFVFRVHKNGSEQYLAEIRDPGNLDTVWAEFGSNVVVSDVIYALSEDTDIDVQIVSKSSVRVVIKVAGSFEDSSQTILANSGVSALYFYIYEEMVVQVVEFVATGTITLSDNNNAGICFCSINSTNITNESCVYESGDTELTVNNDGAKNTSKYIGIISDQLNITGVDLSETHTGTASFDKYVDNVVSLMFRLNNGTVLAGTQVCAVAWRIDSADKGEAQDTATTRPLIVNELLDVTNEATISGDNVTNLNTPDTLSLGPKALDAARHYDPSLSNDNVKLNSALGVYSGDLIFKSELPILDNGSGCILTYFGFDDDAANAILDADIGTNGTWKAVSTGSDRDTSNDSVTGLRDKALDTTLGYGVLSNSDHLNAFFKNGSIFVKIKPLFNYDVGTWQTVFYVYIDSDNLIHLHYDYTSDKFELFVKWGGTSSWTRSTAFTNNLELQKFFNIIASWNSTTNQIMLSVNDNITLDVNAGTPSNSDPSSVTIGAKNDRGLPGAFYFEEFFSISGNYLPWGGYFTNQTGSYVIHDDGILSFWNAEGSSLQIGTGSVAYTGTISNSGGPGGNYYFSNGATGNYLALPISGNLLSNEGVFSCLFQFNQALTSDCTFLYSSETFKVLWLAAQKDLIFTYGNNTVQTEVPLDDTNTDLWHRLKIGWKVNSDIEIDVDKNVSRNNYGIITPPTFGTNLLITAENTSGLNRAAIKVS